MNDLLSADAIGGWQWQAQLAGLSVQLLTVLATGATSPMIKASTAANPAAPTTARVSERRRLCAEATRPRWFELDDQGFRSAGR